MDVSDIIWLARTLTHTDSTQVPDATAIDYLNIIYFKFANRIITEIDEDYFWETFTTDTVVDQSEYVLPIASSTAEWAVKINRVEIKYDSTVDYNTVAAADTLSNFDKSEWFLKANKSQDNPIYDVRDWSIFIYPAPDEAVTTWLKINVINTLKDLLTTDVETAIFPWSQELRIYHDILAIWMKQYIYSSQGLTWDKNDAINEFNLVLDKAIETIRDRTLSPMIAELPNSQSLQY